METTSLASSEPTPIPCALHSAGHPCKTTQLLSQVWQLGLPLQGRAQGQGGANLQLLKQPKVPLVLPVGQLQLTNHLPGLGATGSFSTQKDQVIQWTPACYQDGSNRLREVTSNVQSIMWSNPLGQKTQTQQTAWI